MDPNCANSMTGEPNQPNRSSVFGFDPYPPPYVNWSHSDAFTNNPITQIHPGPSLQQSQICVQNQVVPQFPTQIISEQPNMPPVSEFTMAAMPQQQLNFSFGAPRPATQDVVQFPFQVTHQGFGTRIIQPIRCKRKTDSPPLQPMKQHITEEKMAEHMSKLHISSETATSSKETESDRTQRLYLCEEMRKLQTDSILPQSLIARIQRPCTALVLWKPPSILPLANNDTDENENNNEQQQPDNNVVVNELEMENDVINNVDMDNYYQF